MGVKIIDDALSKLASNIDIAQSKIEIKTDRDSYFAGEVVSADIVLYMKKPVKARCIAVRLYCIETKKIKSTYVMDQYDYRLEKELGVPRSTHIKTTTSNEKKIIYSETKKISMEEFGNETLRFEFEIPKNGRRSDGNFEDGAAVSWVIEAKLDVAFALDISARKEIKVF